MAKSKIDRELDRLYAAPLDEFTATRNEIAAAMGDDVRVGTLRKPTVPAWAVNQAVHRAPKRAAELTKAGAALRKAQEGLSGDGGRDRFRSAQQRVRDAVRELRSEAEAALEDAGRPATASVGDQIEQTLQAGALDPETGQVVTSGRLERPDVAVGFPGVAPSGGASTASPSRARKDAEKRLKRERDRLAEATARREAAEAEHGDAERNAEAAAKALERARNKLEAESKREEEAAAEVERLRGELG